MKNLRNRWQVAMLFFVSCIASAQLPDGVTATQSFIDTVIVNYTRENSIPFDINTNEPAVTLPLNINIIMNRKGLAGVTQSDIIYSVALANSYFRNAGIQFYIDTIAYVSDYNYSFITYNNLRNELLTSHAISNRINIFYADSIKMGASACYGFTYFPDEPDSNYIFLDKDYASGNSLTTMLGHYMGLLSTHDTTGGRELVNEENCSASGDFICDTYADPDLFNQVIDSCRYIGNMRDETGIYYIPSVANIMSASPDKCRCILTPLQHRRIYYYYHKYRHYIEKKQD